MTNQYLNVYFFLTLLFMTLLITAKITLVELI